MRFITARKRLILSMVVGLLVIFSFSINNTKAQGNEERLRELNQQIEEYEEELSRLRSQANTLENQIDQFDAQIRLTTLKIEQTEEKIRLLGGRIDRLEVSLQALSTAFSQRASESYKMDRINSPFYALVSAPDLNTALSRYHYLRKIQEADRDLLMRLEKAQGTYEEEKEDQEDLFSTLEEQKNVLGAQKQAKAQLLEVTRNNEERYQSLLAKARAELEAIQAIIAGKGEEVEVGGVSTGEGIASIIPGASACSSGGHLHYEVVKGGAHSNPASFLSSKSVIWDNGPDGEFTFTGSWPWPLNDPVRITQGYGMTYYAGTLGYYGGAPHTGIDMVNSDMAVKAVKEGTLYRGAISCGGGSLRYVRVEQNDGYSSYYLHVNY